MFNESAPRCKVENRNLQFGDHLISQDALITDSEINRILHTAIIGQIQAHSRRIVLKFRVSPTIISRCHN